jgi:hypothetical protein
LWNVIHLGCGVEPRLKGWMSRCEDKERLLTFSSQTSHLPGMITGLLRFFERRIFLSVYPNQSDGSKRGKDS